LELVRLLVQRGADVNARGRYAINCDGETPLHYACHRGLLDVAMLLLEHGAAPSLAVRNQLGVTPLEWAAQASFERPSELCDLLLRSGAELTLRAAMQMGRREDVDRLVAHAPRHPDLFVHWFRGLRARGYDASADYQRTVTDGVRRWMPTLTRLVAAGAPIDGTGPLAYTPALHEAVNAADPILAEALLELGADPLTKDSNGTTALDKAHGPVHALLEQRARARTPGG
jgi:ankyrin repeat protein